jgi:acyl carrier protein
MGDDTFNRIRSIIAADLEIAPGKVRLPTSFIDDLRADSLDMIELIMAFEDAFDVMIPDIAVETMVTVQDAVDYIMQQKPRRSDGPGM